jgi:hypothetical protein
VLGYQPNKFGAHIFDEHNGNNICILLWTLAYAYALSQSVNDYYLLVAHELSFAHNCIVTIFSQLALPIYAVFTVWYSWLKFSLSSLILIYLYGIRCAEKF